MERRKFFNRLLAGGIGLAIAPHIAAEQEPDPAKVHERVMDPPGLFTISDLDEALVAEPNHYIFSGRQILWNDKGELICEMDEGSVPMINDFVLIQPLWDSNEVNIAALVTAVVRQDALISITVHLTTLDKDAPEMIDKIIGNHFYKTAYYGGYVPHVNPEYRAMVARFAYRGMVMANMYKDHPHHRYRGRLTYKDAYPKTTGGIWPHLDEIAPGL